MLLPLSPSPSLLLLLLLLSRLVYRLVSAVPLPPPRCRRRGIESILAADRSGSGSK
jgi:hypothetical protein